MGPEHTGKTTARICDRNRIYERRNRVARCVPREYTKMKMINVVTDKKICYNIYTMCKNKKGKEMEIKDEIKKLRESTGMNRKEFCEYFEIPYRTVTEWERGTRKMPDYVLRLLAYKVKMDNLIVKEDVNEE